MNATHEQTDTYTQLVDHRRELSLLGSSASILGWDQEVMMPAGGVAYRAQQLALLARLCHERQTDPRVGDWLSELEAANDFEPGSFEAANLREIRHSYDRATKLPASLVESLALTTAEAKAAWQAAREGDDYKLFQPHLDKILELSREMAACYGVSEGGEPWDALADGYEPGMTAAAVEAVFVPLRERLVELIERIRAATPRVQPDLDTRPLGVAMQKSFVRGIAEAMGFDFDRGRLDESAHPFCSGSHYADVRLTSRYRDDMVLDALGSTMHEAGHGLYEQGLPQDQLGLPAGSAAGLGIHESQSRLWENQVGRSRAFWAWALPRAQAHFGDDALSGLTLDAVYAEANLVRPGLIRVESDEATYNLHIMIRFDLERAMLKGDLSAADLPAAWNARYKADLGLDVPSDAQGCLQDIHWSMGALGYFPTYTLGNLYSAQFFEAAREALGDIDGENGQLSRGEFAPLLDWLRENIHAQGHRFHAAELCERATGKPLSADPLMRHLENKLGPLYGLD